MIPLLREAVQRLFRLPTIYAFVEALKVEHHGY
jgi:hypothetical protein